MGESHQFDQANIEPLEDHRETLRQLFANFEEVEQCIRDGKAMLMEEDGENSAETQAIVKKMEAIRDKFSELILELSTAISKLENRN